MNLPQLAGTAMEAQENYCPRHPSTQTNLRCGRCGELICPRCMVTSPVGARCPDCASIGRPTVMVAGAGDLSRATIATLAVGLVGGIALALLVRLMWALPGLNFFGFLLTAIALIGIGVPAGEIIRMAARRSMDTRVRYLAALSILIVYSVAIFVIGLLNAPAGLFLHLFVLIGLGMGMWTAMNRVRP